MIKKLLVSFIMIFAIINFSVDGFPNREQYNSLKTKDVIETRPIEISKGQAMELINEIDCEELVKYMEDREMADRKIAVLNGRGNYLSEINIDLSGRYKSFEDLSDEYSEIIIDNKTNTNYIIERILDETTIETVKEIEVNGAKKSVLISNWFTEKYDEDLFPTIKTKSLSILGENEESIIYGITYPTRWNDVDGILISDGPIAGVVNGEQLNENLVIINEDGLEIGTGTPEGYELVLREMKNSERIKIIYFIIQIASYIASIIIVLRWIIKFRKRVISQ